MEEDSPAQLDLRRVKKGKVSLAEALHKLDIVTSYLSRLQTLERTAHSHELAIAELKLLGSHYATTNGLQVAIEQVKRELRETVTQAVTDSQAQFDQKIQDFPTRQAIDSALSYKASSAVVSRLHDSVVALNHHFEALNSSVFESFKVEIKRSLATKLDGDTIEDTLRYITESEAWKRLLDRIELTERSIRDMETNSVAGSVVSPSEVTSVKGKSGLTKMVTGTQHELNMLKEQVREWKADLGDKIEGMEEEILKVKSANQKEIDRLRKQVSKIEAKKEIVEVSQEREESGSPRRTVEKPVKELESITKRFVKIETEISNLLLTTEFMKSRQRDKITEFGKKIQILSEYKDIYGRELAGVQGKFTLVEDTHRRDMAKIEEELSAIRGPMVDMLNTKAQESGALNTEIKRHQELFRTFVTDYNYAVGAAGMGVSVTPTMKTSPPPFFSPGRLENLAMGRVHSASPAIKLRKRLHAAVTPKKDDTFEDSLNISTNRARNRFSLDRRKLSTSRKSTPRRFGDPDSSLP